MVRIPNNDNDPQATQQSILEYPPIDVRYTNHRGETRIRTIVPVRFCHKRTPYHSDGAEWIMECFDIDKHAMRDYSLKDCDFVDVEVEVNG